MLSASAISQSVPLNDEASQKSASSGVRVLQDEDVSNATSKSVEPPNLHQLDKSEINDAVTKVLQGYDWTLVPIASK